LLLVRFRARLILVDDGGNDASLVKILNPVNRRIK